MNHVKYHTHTSRHSSTDSFQCIGRLIVGPSTDQQTRLQQDPRPRNHEGVWLRHFVDGYVDDNTKKYTNENRVYVGFKNHKSINYYVGVRGMAHVNGMESFWSMINRGYDDAFNHMSEGHVYHYVNEFADRHNIRSIYIINIIGTTMVEHMAGSRLMFEYLVMPSKIGGGI